MNLRRLLHSVTLAGALALGIGSAAKADEMAPNSNNLPLTCPDILPREIIRNVKSPNGDERSYRSYVGLSAQHLLVVTQSEDPDVRIGAAYRAPLGADDFVEVVAENRPGIFRGSKGVVNPGFRNGISSANAQPPLVRAGEDYLISLDELPADFQEGTFTYWAQSRRFNSLSGREETCASVRYPVALYRAPDVREITQNPVGTVDRRPAVLEAARLLTQRTPRAAPQEVRRAGMAAPIIAKREFSLIAGAGVDQYTAKDSIGNRYDPLDVDLKSIAARYRWLGKKGKVDIRGAITQGDDKAGESLRALDAELHVDYKLFRSKASPGISIAAGVKDVRTYAGAWGERSRQGNGYGFAGVNLSLTGDGGFASENFVVARAGALAQPIIDKKASFDGRGYTATTDMELAYPEFSLDARKLLADHVYADAQLRASPKVKTVYTSPNTKGELTKTSEYLNLTLGLGYRFETLDAYVQAKWAHDRETWRGLSDLHGDPHILNINHDGIAVRGGVVFHFGKKDAGR